MATVGRSGLIGWFNLTLAALLLAILGYHSLFAARAVSAPSPAGPALSAPVVVDPPRPPARRSTPTEAVAPSRDPLAGLPPLLLGRDGRPIPD